MAASKCKCSWLTISITFFVLSTGGQCLLIAQVSNPPDLAKRKTPVDQSVAQAQFEKAAALIKKRDYSEAVSLLRSAVRLAPNQPDYHHYLGYTLWKLDHWKQAEAEFEKAHELNPRDPYTCYFLARIAGAQGDINRSLKYYQAVLRLGPAIYDTGQRMGQAYLDQGKVEKARTMIEAALQKTPWDGSLYYQLGRIDQREHRSAQAREEFAAAVRLKNGNQTSIRQLLDLSEAVRNHQTGRIQQIRESFLSRNAPNPEIYDSIGVLLGEGGLYADALEPLRRSVKLAPNSYESNYDLGLTLFKLGREREAEDQLKKALTLQPGSMEVNRLLGLLYAKENRNPDAIERLRTAHQSAPSDNRILALLCDQYLVGHYVSNAVSCLTKAIDQQPDNPAIRYLVIDAYQQEHDYPRALAAAQAASKRLPNDARFVYQEGQQLANIGDYQKARPYAEKAIQMDPTLVYAYDLLGDIQSKDGEFASALASFIQARGLVPDDELALKGIAENLIRLRRYTEALSELKEAIAARPQDANLYFNLMQVYTRLGKHQEASQAEAAFQKFHNIEVAERNAQAPRRFKSSAGTGSN